MDDQDRYTRITLRIPKDLHAKLQAASDDSSKSMNAEIIERVENSFSAPDPSAAINAINRLEAELSEKSIQLDETERLALLMSTALGATYGITKLALMASPDDMAAVRNVLDSGMSAVRSFTSSYTPRGMEPLAKQMEAFRHFIDAESYENLVKSIVVSEETNTLLKQSEEKALALINKTLDKHNIQEMPHSRRFTLFAHIKDMPHPEDVFEQAVQAGESDDPIVRKEQERRGLDTPDNPISDRTVLLRGLEATAKAKQSSTPTIPGANAPKGGSKAPKK